MRAGELTNLGDPVARAHVGRELGAHADVVHLRRGHDVRARERELRDPRVQPLKAKDAPIDERRWEDVEATRFDALHFVVVLMDASVSNSKQLTNRRELQRECVRVELA